MEETVFTNRIKISNKWADEMMKKKLEACMDEYISEFKALLGEIRDVCKNNKILQITGNALCIDVVNKFAYYDLTKIEPLEEVKSPEYFGEYLEKHSPIDGWVGEIPTLKQLRSKRSLLNNNDSDRGLVYKDAVGYGLYIPSNDREVDNLKYRFVEEGKYIFPVNNLVFNDSADLLVNILIPLAMCPEALSDSAKVLFADLTLLKAINKDYVVYKSAETMIFAAGQIVGEFMKNPEKDIYQKLNWKLTEVLREYYKTRCVGDVNMDIDVKKNMKESLLQCEKIRADIEPYEERILMDPNRGHWDLWEEQSETEYTVKIAEKMVARNPICDINEDGVIAIDFGTKSTIVVYQSNIEHSLPMRIGDGNLSKDVAAKRYENPTVMHFVNLGKFMDDYHSKGGRPNTEWNDLTISHTAMDQFSASSSEEYYEYLQQIKQWAGQRKKQFRIQPHIGDSIVLPAFLDLKDEDINPIEIYAYYIGLYINNMRHGIFLDYYLSFPVTYEVRIREKIVESFEKGLKKSLPETLLNNQEIMSRFRVNGDISEPAAYAVCALQEYGFDPAEDEEIFYGIFDFGGGTTDFDFGLWKQSAKRRYDYTIENFGAGGDEFLGGENLLEMLAFEIFKKNQDLMRERGYTFTLAPKCKEFLGSDALLSDSQEAEKNMHNLMEVLRPYWEEYKESTDSEADKQIKIIIEKIDDLLVICQDGEYLDYVRDLTEIRQKILHNSCTAQEALEFVMEIAGFLQVQIENIDWNKSDVEKSVVTLFDREGKDHVNEELEFSLHEINQFFENKIREGVNNFFSALLLSYQNEKVKKPTTVNILLAGNSSKSPIVRKVFEEEIEKRQKEIKEKYQIEEEIENLFEIFPPLGTEEAYKKMEERGLPFERDNFEKPTGKTGVAFGLLQCRKGGNIERITNVDADTEIPFQYFIGRREKKKFVMFRDDSKLTKYKGKPDYNVWYKFVEANEDVFDLYYTSLPECVNGDMFVDGNAAVKRNRCNIDTVDEKAFVYIRAVGPHTLEYVVAAGDDVEKSMLGEITRKEFE